MAMQKILNISIVYYRKMIDRTTTKRVVPCQDVPTQQNELRQFLSFQLQKNQHRQQTQQPKGKSFNMSYNFNTINQRTSQI